MAIKRPPRPNNEIEDRKLIESVKRGKARYLAITPEVAEFPYVGVTITFDMWQNAMTATEYLGNQDNTIAQLDAMTQGGFSRLVSVFGTDYLSDRTGRDFTRVINGLKRGITSDIGETVEVDRFGCPNIAPYMAGCRESVSVSVDEIDSIDLDTFIAPWHGYGPTTDPFFRGQPSEYKYEAEGGEEYAVLAYNALWSWDQYRVIVNLCAAGFERAIRGILGGKAEARQAAQLDLKAAVIDYGSITGIQTGYTLACNVMDERIAQAIRDGKTHIHYEPDSGIWGPTMDVYLPDEHLKSWRETEGSNPIQLKRLRGVIFTMLVHTDPPLWWKQQRQVTLTLGQIERAYWNDPKHKARQAERDLLVSSISFLVNTRFESKYPTKDKKKRHEKIDVENLVHEGITLLPAQFVRGVDAKGHVVDAENAALQFYALPPLDMDADVLNEAYNVPYLDGSKSGLAALRRAESTTYDVETELAKYIRIAVDKGRATGYVADIARTTDSDYAELEAKVGAIVEQAIYTGGNVEEAKEEKKRAQARLRKIRSRVKRDIHQVLPILVSNERLKHHYLIVTTTRDKRGFTIERVKATRDQKTKKLVEPPYVCEF